MKPLRFAIAGAGRIAADYLSVLKDVPELSLVGVADPRPRAAGAAAERWGCPAFGTTSELLRATRPEAVLVAAPPREHEPLTLECLEAGAHVLCEKPFALDLAAGRRMLALGEARGLHVTMSAKFRHVADVIEAKARLLAGAVGRVVLAENVFAAPVPMVQRWNSQPSVSGGGVIVDNGTHSADLLRYLLGPVDWVQAVAAPRLQPLEVEDTARLTLGLACGVVASVDLSWSLQSFEGWYLAVHGEDGTLRLGWQGCTLFRRGAETGLAFGTGYSKLAALERQLRHFARTAGGQEERVLTASDLLASIAVVDAAYASLGRDGARAKVPAAEA